MPSFSPSDLTGILPPMVTPFDAVNEEIDEAALRQDIRYMIEVGKVHGIVVGGSTGEGHTLSTKEATRLVRIAMTEAKGRVPVVAGIIVDSTQQAIERAEAVADLGPAALQITPVHYLFRPDDNHMLEHFRTVGRATKIPILIYNVIPWSYLSPALLIRILKEIPQVVGVKQSAGDMKLLADLLLGAPKGSRKEQCPAPCRTFTMKREYSRCSTACSTPPMY